MSLFSILKKIANNEGFQTLILFVIILNALFLWLETYPLVMEQYSSVIVPVLVWSQMLFVIEIIIRILAYGPRNYKNFFWDFWNKFDFTIVLLSFLPEVGWFIMVARVFRVLRILRIFSISDIIRNYFNTLRATWSLVLVLGCIYLVLTYTLSIIWFYSFWEIDSIHWGTLHNAFISIVFMSLFQDVWEIFGDILKVYPVAIFFVILFYLLECTMIVKFFTSNSKK